MHFFISNFCFKNFWLKIGSKMFTINGLKKWFTIKCADIIKQNVIDYLFCVVAFLVFLLVSNFSLFLLFVV